MTPRLTLNYGVRWEPYLALYNDRGENENFNPALFAAGVHSSVFTNAPAGLFFPGDPQYTSGITHTSTAPIGRSSFPGWDWLGTPRAMAA